MPEETSVASSSESAEEKPCSSTAAAAGSSVEVLEEAKKLIGTGKRHLVMGDVVSAVNVFQEACSMLAEKYGDTADECGEAFFLCGKSLLELARMENSVLGNALEGVPEESEEEEQPSSSNVESPDNLDEKTRDELRQQVYDAMAEKEKAEDPHSPVTGDEKSLSQETEMDGVSSVKSVQEGSLGKETEIEQKADSSEEQTGSGTGVKPVRGCDEDKEETEDDDDDEDGEKNGQDKEEEEVGNLQLAWEMLEVAKVIYKRKESTEDQLMAAQAYLKLGEVSAESGNYPQALDDFQECLALQLKYLPPHIRLLAETHYHVATTLCYMDQYSQAIQHYNSSIKVIETRLAMLQEVIDAAEGTDGAAEEKNELDELKLLLPDIREKVEDAKESQKTASAASQAIQQTLGGASTSSAFLCENGSTSSAAFATTSQVPVKTESASSSKAVSDISHLVRKKRKPEDESPVKDTDAKQAKQEATVNGSGDSSASNGNGVQEGKSQESATQSASVESPA
ncbi:nuclear autoantigenic sperm protein-like isoform X7 [Simochromis diagramma]|uniref:nuclear autoantigenic sperm protein-like isoform X7 n=1 Tax=Simochromis diagramma TaxID=43689 RepID=UPI001A7EB0A7|nr:nuclear autoantigenic sperm protein-like isoform X7 [Simochromis diagramma]